MYVCLSQITGDIPSFEDHLHSLFTVVHVGPLATGIQSLMLLFQVMESRSSVSGRYYQALYAKLMDPALKHSGKQVRCSASYGRRGCQEPALHVCTVAYLTVVTMLSQPLPQ